MRTDKTGKLVFKEETASALVHRKVREENQDDNSAVESADSLTGAAETIVHKLDSAAYGRKLKKRQDMEKEKAGSRERTSGFSHFYQKKAIQKKAIQKEYQAGRYTAGPAATSAGAAERSFDLRLIGEKLRKWKQSAEACVYASASHHPHLILVACLFLLLLLSMIYLLSSCSTSLPVGESITIATSYTAQDADIIGANDDYKAMEAKLQKQIDLYKTAHPGYDDYKYFRDEIGHDPYQLASYLTVLYEDYTREEVQDTLKELFREQYGFTTKVFTETRYRTEKKTGTREVTDPETGEITTETYEYTEQVPYQYRTLTLVLKNYSLGTVIANKNMTEDEKDRYQILLETKGNKEDLFIDDAYVVSSKNGLSYEVSGEALTDERFANMLKEAEKYLGYPYVWGGSSPSTSFDCSGYVSYVINHCGNGWSVGRQTANGLKNLCSIIPESSAKPGDLIFFQGTYSTSGASHVGIIVDPEKKIMIHCGSPIQYASYDTSYWRKHYYCIGRIPD